MTRNSFFAPLALFLSFFLSTFCLHAQKSIWNAPAAYLGQKPPGDKPEPFALDLVLKNDTFSMDRVAFSADGRTLYLLGGADRKKDTAHAYVYQSHRTADGGWTEPTVYLRTKFGTYDYMPTLSGTVYIASNVHPGKVRDYSDYDISTMRVSGRDTVVKSLGEPLNTPGFDGDFYVAPDESYIILSNKETKTFECELAISFRRGDGSWTAPASLGPEINDRVAHRWGEYVSPEGKYLFYSTGTSPKDCHIVWVRWDTLLEKLRRENLR